MDFHYSALAKTLFELTGRTLISFHSRGDVEAVASALALSKLVLNSTVKSSDKISGQARSVLKNLKIVEPAVLKEGELQSFQNVVLVDVANPKMLGENFAEELAKFKGKKIVIDHHIHSGSFKKTLVFEFPNRTSCCEVMLDLFKVAKFKIDSKSSALLLAGVIVDTASFESANSQTFLAVASLLRLSKISYCNAKRVVERKVDFNELKTKLANLANCKVLKVESENLAFCNCSAFESATASLIAKSGAAVAVCFNKKSSEVFLVKSASSRVFESLNSAFLLNKVVKITGGESGGHELIAGAKLPSEKLELALKLLESELLNRRWF